MKKSSCIYGVDLEAKFTPLDVKKAIVKCFTEAHQEVLKKWKSDLGLREKEFKEIKKMRVNVLIDEILTKNGADSDKPTKKDLIKLIEGLQVYALQFRSPEIVSKHACEIKQLIDRL